MIKKILFIAPNYLPHIGGVEKHIYYLSQEMLKDNHQVDILTLKYNNTYKDIEEDGNLKVIRVDKSSKKFGNRINTIKYMFKSIKNILKYDIIHIHDYSTFEMWIYPIYPILKLFNKKIYITFHGYEGDIPPRKQVIFRRKMVEKLATKNICIGHFIEKYYDTKADIVSYGGVNKVDNILENKEEYLLFIGRLAPDTGIFDYIKAWELISKNSDLKFVICGDGVLREEIEKYIKKNNIQNIIFKGFVSDVESYIKDAKIIFTAGYLGILEAFSYKKNVIATYDNVLKEDYLKMILNYHEMMWVADNDIDNIVDAVNEAIGDTTKKKIAYIYSLENSWEKVKNDYYKLWGNKIR